MPKFAASVLPLCKADSLCDSFFSPLRNLKLIIFRVENWKRTVVWMVGMVDLHAKDADSTVGKSRKFFWEIIPCLLFFLKKDISSLKKIEFWGHVWFDCGFDGNERLTLVSIGECSNFSIAQAYHYPANNKNTKASSLPFFWRFLTEKSFPQKLCYLFDVSVQIPWHTKTKWFRYSKPSCFLT